MWQDWRVARVAIKADRCSLMRWRTELLSAFGVGGGCLGDGAGEARRREMSRAVGSSLSTRCMRVDKNAPIDLTR